MSTSDEAIVLERSDRLQAAIDQWLDGSIRAFQSEIQPLLKARDIRGGSYPMIHRYLRGTPQPNVGFLLVAADVLRVRSGWLIDGTGSMTDAEQAVRDSEALIGAELSEDEARLLYFLDDLDRRWRGKKGGGIDLQFPQALLWETIERLAAASPVDEAETDVVGKVGLLLGKSIDQQLKLVRPQNLTMSARQYRDYLVASWHALMIAIPDRNQGFAIAELLEKGRIDE